MAPAGTFNGIQMGPHTMLDEGIEHTLDLIAETAGITAVMPYSHAYNAALVKPLRDRADHGVPLTDNTGRRFPLVWVRTHDEYYRETTLRHPARDPRDAHADRDLFQEMIAPARARRMKVYARVLESSAMSRVVANYSKVVTRDVNDRPDQRRLLESSGVRRLLGRHDGGPVQELRPGRDSMGRRAAGPAHERDFALEQRSADVFLRALPGARPRGGHRSRSRA